MFRSLAVALAALTVGSPQAAVADHYMQTADPQVVQAVQEIVRALGQGCNAGNTTACKAIPRAQQQAHIMLSAGHDCQYGGQPQACQFYQANIFQLQQAYQQVSMAMQSGALMTYRGGGGARAGLSHAQRMQQIHDWGQQRLDYGAQSQALLDNNHAQFMEMLRQ